MHGGGSVEMSDESRFENVICPRGGYSQKNDTVRKMLIECVYLCACLSAHVPRSSAASGTALILPGGGKRQQEG